MLILFKAPSLCTVLFLLPPFLSTTDEVLLVDDFAPILVLLNRGKSQSSKVSTHLSPSVTARLVLDGRAVGEDGPPFFAPVPPRARDTRVLRAPQGEGLEERAAVHHRSLGGSPPSPTCSIWLHQAGWKHQDDELTVTGAVLPAVPFRTGQVGGHAQRSKKIMWVGFIY